MGYPDGFVTGLAVGAVLASSWTVVQKRVHHCPEPDADALTDADREVVAAEFAAHQTAVRQQVSDYADHLAGGDTALRELLAAIERADTVSDELAGRLGGGR